MARWRRKVGNDRQCGAWMFLLPGNLVSDALGAREDDDCAMIRSLINMLVWNLAVVSFVVLW